jgi:hypothetical protein
LHLDERQKTNPTRPFTPHVGVMDNTKNQVVLGLVCASFAFGRTSKDEPDTPLYPACRRDGQHPKFHLWSGLLFARHKQNIVVEFHLVFVMWGNIRLYEFQVKGRLNENRSPASLHPTRQQHTIWNNGGRHDRTGPAGRDRAGLAGHKHFRPCVGRHHGLYRRFTRLAESDV